jgi:hypothetical protein
VADEAFLGSRTCARTDRFEGDLMASYDDLGGLVGKLKRSAIDAWMHDEGWEIYGDDHYEMSSSSTNYKVSRPGSDGEGGGDWSSDFFIELFVDRDDEFKAAFSTIRSSVDALVKRWTDLPDPSTIGDIVESSRQITRGLAGAAASADGTATGSGDLAGYLELIEHNIDAMSGETIAAYKAKFLIQLGKAVGGFHAISVVSGAAVAGQQGLWEAARQDVADIIDGARKVMDSIAEGDSVTWSEALTVVGFAAKGLGLFASGGLSVAIGVANLGIDVVKAGSGPTEVKNTISAGSYENAIGDLEKALDGLASQIGVEEQLIDTNLSDNMANIRNDKTSYDLTQPPISSSEGIIVITKPLVDEITNTHMPAVAVDLDSIAAIGSSFSTYSAVSRDASIGIGQSGPSANMGEINWLLYELLKDLSWEVTKGAQSLKLAVAQLEDYEQSTADELARVAAEVGKGSTYNPWD